MHYVIVKIIRASENFALAGNREICGNYECPFTALHKAMELAQSKEVVFYDRGETTEIRISGPEGLFLVEPFKLRLIDKKKVK